MFTNLLNTWRQLRRVVSDQFVDLLPWALDDGQTLTQSCLEWDGAAHRPPGPAGQKTQAVLGVTQVMKSDYLFK